MKNTFKMMAAMLFMGAAMCICGCSKDDSSNVSNELVGTTWHGAPEFSGEDYDLYLDLTIYFSTNTTGSYIQIKNGDAQTWNFTYSYSGNTGRVSNAPFNKFTIKGNKLYFDPGITYGGYPLGELFINKQ